MFACVERDIMRVQPRRMEQFIASYDYGDDGDQFGSIFSKIARKVVPKAIYKPLAKVVKVVGQTTGTTKAAKILDRSGLKAVAGFQLSVVTGGLVGAKRLGIQSKQGKKGAKIGRYVGKAGLVVAGAVVAAPLLPAVGSGLATVGSALAAGAGAVGSFLVKAAPGAVKMGSQLVQARQGGPGLPSQGPATDAYGRPIAEAGMFGNLFAGGSPALPLLLMAGVGLVVIAVYGGSGYQSKARGGR